ncbi:MAG: hypothetical protein JO041_06320 [Acidobacteria bacterium]|nr:hypothetical protein [Acidobacteriota bacterium]
MPVSAVTTAATNRINWPRVLGCGALAGVVWIVLGTLLTALLARDFIALPGNRLGAPTPGFIVFNIVLDLLTGMGIVWLYAAIRPGYGAGPKTAAVAAFAVWFIVSLEDGIWCSFGLFPARTVIPLIFGTLPALIVAALAGARFYKEQGAA